MATLTALVADDDLDMLDMIAIGLEDYGFRVVRAASGAELLECLMQAQYGLIITDIAMPWMTGLQVLRSARNAGLQTPVIVMTGLRGSDLDRQVAALGDAAILLRKPFNLPMLHAALRKAVGP